MNKILLIGAGAAGSVVAKKCLQLPDIFSRLHIASRTLSKCRKLQDLSPHTISISQLDADCTDTVYDLIKEQSPNLVINMALPYQDISIMKACLKAGVNYLDTANYEPKDEAKFCYKWQWDFHEKFKEAGLTALLGSGFDPGVTNVFCAYAQKEYFDTIETIDILDCNAGDHGHPFATNFNPEINIREITQRGKYWDNGKWIETDPLSQSRLFDFPEVGEKKAYLMYHEEIESLAKNIKGVETIRFWMTFSEEYLTHLKVLQNVGMTRIDTVKFNGQDIVPLQFLKEVLPEPSSLGENYQGKTCIGCLIKGKKDGQDKTIFIYNICDHQDCYKEVQSQAVSYTTGVPAMIGAKLLLEGTWNKPGTINIEEFDPTPFMDALNKYGLPWKVIEYGS
ncbi:saccharopine dehydrogenase [Candidatus Marinamargulisbacteria bacterium SCGC AAA071-K20]|nr:saccharopine dehydrogenase [Candidatus Marinamargulisbacteria bacterium SCGC AAA071-K20]